MSDTRCVSGDWRRPYAHDWRVGAPHSRRLDERWNGQAAMKIDAEAPLKPDDSWKPADVVTPEQI